MFVCDKCGKSSKPKEKVNFIVDKRRKKVYNNDNKITFGWEIESEKKICKRCLEKMNGRGF